jgi:hypothetical protein
LGWHHWFLPNVERLLDCLVQLGEFFAIACAHKPIEALSGNREHVVEVCDAASRKSLSAAEDNFRRKFAHRSGNECDYDGADRIDN